jgi:hypothetical protein
MEKPPFDKQAALHVLDDMINATRYKVQQESKYFLLWGWMVFAAAISHFILLQLNITMSWLVWPILMSIAGISYIYMIMQSKSDRYATSYIDRVNKYLWGGIIFPLIIAVLVGVSMSWNAAYPFFMGIYGWSAIVSGGLLRFKPLITGGIISSLLGIVTVFISGSFILILLALSILSGFIYPGHAFKRIEE